MDRTSPTKAPSTQQCLICNQCTTDSKRDTQSSSAAITIKTEAGQIIIAEPLEFSPRTTASVGTFCKLLQLSPSCTNSLQTDLPSAAGHTWPVFCGVCEGTITRITDLYDQVRRLQLQIGKSRNQVETQIQQCFSDHVASSGGSLALHSCISAGRGRGKKARTQCSLLDQLREVIVSDIQAKAAVANQDADESLVTNASHSPTETQPRTSRPRKTYATPNSNSRSRIRKLRKPEEPEVILGDFGHSTHDIDNDDADFDPGHMEHQFDSESDRKGEVYNFVLADPKLKTCAVKLRKIDVDGSDSSISNAQTQKSAQTRRKLTRLSRPRRRKPLVPREEKVKKLKKKGKRATTTCTLCSARFQGDFYLQYHYNKVHGTSQFATFCSTCGKRFYTESTFQTHLRVQGGTCRKSKIPDTVIVQMEPGTPNFKCKICGKTARTREHMRNHHMTHSKEKRYACETCGAMFKLRLSLKMHRLLKHPDPTVPHPFSCPEPGCGRLCGNQRLFDVHLKTHTGNYNFFCDRCPFKTFHAAAFKTHVEAVHEDVRRYPCTQCPKAYKKSTQLQKHIYAVHTAPEDRPFKCRTCGKTFSEKYCLDRHEIIHTTLKPIKCEICDKRFAVSDYLRMHMKVHNGRPRSKTAAQSKRKAGGKAQPQTSKPASVDENAAKDQHEAEAEKITISEVSVDFDGMRPTSLAFYGPP